MYQPNLNSVATNTTELCLQVTADSGPCRARSQSCDRAMLTIGTFILPFYMYSVCKHHVLIVCHKPWRELHSWNELPELTDH